MIESTTTHHLSRSGVYAPDCRYIPINGEKLLPELIPRILLELYGAFSDYDPQRGKVLRRTLAACCLVCRRWRNIVGSDPSRFMFYIQISSEYWASPSFSWYRLRHIPSIPQDGGGANQQSHSRWVLQNYTTAPVNSYPRFLPELMPNLFAQICLRDEFWEYEEAQASQKTLAACCLVSHEWNRIFTPLLYKDIFLGGEKPLLTRSLLYRTFRHTQPTRTALVKTVRIEPAKDGSTANLLSIYFSFSFPNLQVLILEFLAVNPAALHPNFEQNLRSLSRRFPIQIKGFFGNQFMTEWGSLPLWINFMRRSGLTPGSFRNSSHSPIFDSTTYFYIGKHETVASGLVDSSDIKSFQQHVSQIGHNLNGLCLRPCEPSSLPKIDLRNNRHLRLLQFNLSLEEKEIRESREDVFQWFTSICESVTSNSLVVEVKGFPNDSEVCNRIQNTLLTLHVRIETFSVYLSNTKIIEDDTRKLFSRLYGAGIVIEKCLDDDELRALASGR